MAIWEWIRSVRALDAQNRDLLMGLGLSPRALQRILFMPGVFERTGDVWEQVLYPVEPDLEYVTDVLGRAMMDLRQFEVSLLSWRERETGALPIPSGPPTPRLCETLQTR